VDVAVETSVFPKNWTISWRKRLSNMSKILFCGNFGCGGLTSRLDANQVRKFSIKFF